MRDCEVPLNKSDRSKYLFVRWKPERHLLSMDEVLQMCICHPQDSQLNINLEAVSWVEETVVTLSSSLQNLVH